MTSIAPPEAVLFDCDGVLVDSEAIGLDLLRANLARHGLNLSPAQVIAELQGLTMDAVRRRAIGLGADLAADWVAQHYRELYARLAEGTPLVPGIAAVLDRLDSASVPYAVGSNGSMRKMEITLGQHPDVYERLRGRLFSGQDVARPKPAPDLYLKAAGALGIAPAACAVIEDSVNGCRAAYAAGIRCFGFAAEGDGADLAAAGARVFHAMDELPTLLGL